MGTSPDGSAGFLKSYHILAVLIAVTVVLLSITGFVWADKGVTLVVNGETRYLNSRAETVGDLLEVADIAVGSSDVLSPVATSPLADGMTIVVRHAKPVIVDIAGETIELDVVGTTVTDALIAAGIDPASGCSVQPTLDTALEPGMTISVSDVFVRVVEEHVDLEYGVVTEQDPSLPAGSRAIKQHGQAGEAVRVYRLLVTNGVEGESVLSAETVISEPLDEVVLVGTDRSASPRVASRAAANVAPPRGGVDLAVTATGYSPGDPGVSNRTATGAKATYGVIAVDPSVIPLGTRVYIPGYGNAIAADTGGAIKGNKIDLCFGTRAEALAWGRRTVTITILP